MTARPAIESAGEAEAFPRIMLSSRINSP